MNYNFLKYFGVVHGEMRWYGWWNSFLRILVWPIRYHHQICPIELTLNGLVPFLNESILLRFIDPAQCNVWSRFPSSGPWRSPSLLLPDSSTRQKEASCTTKPSRCHQRRILNLSTLGMNGGIWTFSLPQEETMWFVEGIIQVSYPEVPPKSSTTTMTFKGSFCFRSFRSFSNAHLWK